MILGLLLLLAAGQWEEGFVPLFNGKDLAGWSVFIQKSGPNEAGTMKVSDYCWVIPGALGVVRDAIIRCKTGPASGTGAGSPPGWLVTDARFTNMTLKLQWRWPEEPGKSGVLIRTQPRLPEDRSFPKGIETQLNACENCSLAGDIIFVGSWPDVPCASPCSNVYPLGGAAVKNQPRWRDNTRIKGEWNDYEVTILKDTLTLKVNGEVVNAFSGIPEIPGQVLLQVEGGTIDFRDIRIKELK